MYKRIKEIRKDAKLTQIEFGKRIGVKGNTITNYETNLRTPTDAVILSICREFSINEDWLRYGKGEMHIAKTRDEEIAEAFADIQLADDFRYKFISALAKLDTEKWKVIEEFIDVMIAERENKEE